jgi:hypothetical protein
MNQMICGHNNILFDQLIWQETKNSTVHTPHTKQTVFEHWHKDLQ